MIEKITDEQEKFLKAEGKVVVKACPGSGKTYIVAHKLLSYIDNWKNSFKNQDFAKMEREYKKLEKQLQQIAPIEKTINEAKTIEVLHNLIKNNGQDFNLTNEQLELAERLK